MNFETQKHLVIHENLDYSQIPIKSSLRNHQENDINQFLRKYPQFVIKNSRSHCILRKGKSYIGLIDIKRNAQIYDYLRKRIACLINYMEISLKNGDTISITGPKMTQLLKEKEYCLNLLKQL